MSDGTRTRGRRDHNPELYQLSYAHQAGLSIAPDQSTESRGSRRSSQPGSHQFRSPSARMTAGSR